MGKRATEIWRSTELQLQRCPTTHSSPPKNRFSSDMIASYVILPATPVKTILAFAHTPEHLRASFCLCRQTSLQENVVWVGGVGCYDPGPRRNGDIAVYYDLASQITSRRYGTEVQEAMVILRHISSDSRDYTPHAIKHRQDLRDFITNFEQKLLVPGDWFYRMANMLLLYYKLKEQFQYSIPSGGALRWSLEKMAIVGTDVAERLSDAVRMGISSSCGTGIATGLKEISAGDFGGCRDFVRVVFFGGIYKG
ncbi:hypothetical protein FPQ18DRAFT_381127 [Pyronema domesticum]|nr:hypothetical protein FPQ18DRAFT_381127 [Pyronema domesticum]